VTGVNDPFNLSVSEGVEIDNNAVDAGRSFVYGDIRTGQSTAIQNLDIGFINTTTLLSEGWQVWNNSASTYGAGDDAVYGVVEGSTSLVLKAKYSTASGISDVEETRVFGVRLLP
jgi:hypothetical protein